MLPRMRFVRAGWWPKDHEVSGASSISNRRLFLFLAQDRRLEGGQSMSALCPGISEIDLFQPSSTSMPDISDRTFDLGMSEQELDGPEIAQIRKCEQYIEKVLSQEDRDRPS